MALGPLLRTAKTTAIGFGTMVACASIGVTPVILLAASAYVLLPLAALIPVFSPIDKPRSISLSLKEHISPLCSRINFPIDHIYISSDRPPGHAVSIRFFGSKTIVIGEHSDYTLEEQAAVIAHELGHVEHNDSFHRWLVRHLPAFRCLVFLAFNAKPELLSQFNLPETIAISMVYQIFTLVFDPTYSLARDVIDHIRGQATEFCADDFAKQHSYGNALASVLDKLRSRTVHYASTDRIYSIYTSSHPSIEDRIERLLRQ
jgi:hypothetical protein